MQLFARAVLCTGIQAMIAMCDANEVDILNKPTFRLIPVANAR